MSKYATVKIFAGQRASVGRVVIVRTNRDGILAGLISQIDSREQIYIFAPGIGVNGPVEGATRSYDFKETKTVEEVEALGEFEWTWPVRV